MMLSLCALGGVSTAWMRTALPPSRATDTALRRGPAGVKRCWHAAQAHAQLAGHERRVRQDRQRQFHLLPDFGEILRQWHLGCAWHRDQELVAAVAPQFAAPSQVGLQPLRNQHQGLVTYLGASCFR